VTRLGQGYNKLSDVSAVRIAEALTTNSTLQSLDLVSFLAANRVALRATCLDIAL